MSTSTRARQPLGAYCPASKAFRLVLLRCFVTDIDRRAVRCVTVKGTAREAEREKTNEAGEDRLTFYPPTFPLDSQTPCMTNLPNHPTSREKAEKWHSAADEHGRMCGGRVLKWANLRVVRYEWSMKSGIKAMFAV